MKDRERALKHVKDVIKEETDDMGLSGIDPAYKTSRTGITVVLPRDKTHAGSPAGYFVSWETVSKQPDLVNNYTRELLKKAKVA